MSDTPRILLAVSGGIDSMYLANSASRLWPGAEFALAHCNFCLRGDESDGDEAFVRDWCNSHGIKCFVKKFDTLEYSGSKGISIEMAARELRYSWFRELMNKEGFDSIAVAHNACDNAETLMLNLLRGTGSKGLRGMSSSGNILRPLLGMPREKIRKEMIANGWTWREDSSNAENDYKRNKIRNLVFPVFAQINPSFLRTLETDMEHFRQVDDIAEDYYLSAREKVLKCGASGIETIIVDRLLELKHWKYVLFRILDRYEFSEQTLEKMIALLGKYKDEPRGTVTLGGKKFESPSYVVKASKGGRLTIYSIEEI